MSNQRERWVCWKSKNACIKSGLIRNTYTRYHICSMRVLIILLSIRYSVCTCRSPIYHYITATTAVYLTQRFVTACVVVMWSHSLYLSRMNSRWVHYVCCKSTSTRWKSGLRWNTHGVDKHRVCLVFCIACICATVRHHYVYVDYYSKLPVTGCRPSDVQSMLGWQGWSCPRVSYHAFERRCACFSYDISWYNILRNSTPHTWFEWTIQQAEYFWL